MSNFRPGQLNSHHQQDPQQELAYQVRLEVFEGPLDLLLYLIEKQELDITKVSLTAVTDQYLDYISHVERLSAENLAGFLVVAAKLLLIKSRALLPSPPEEAREPEEDVGEELARQLREYKRFKELAQQLAALDATGMQAYVRVGSSPKMEKTLDLSGVTLEELLAVVQEALSVQPEAGPVSEVVAAPAFTVSDKIRDIEQRLASRGRFSFQRLLRQAQSRAEVIVTFLALLELIRARRVGVKQDALFGEIFVSAPQETESVDPRPEPQ